MLGREAIDQAFGQKSSSASTQTLKMLLAHAADHNLGVTVIEVDLV